jgi:hypothetical protein
MFMICMLLYSFIISSEYVYAKNVTGKEPDRIDGGHHLS